MTEHDRYRNLTARYALGALTSRERGMFEQHLQTCAECEAEVRSFQPIVATVAESVPRIVPPAHLKERLLSTVQPDVSAASAPPARGMRRTPPRSVWIAAGVLCAVGLATYVVHLHSRIAALGASTEPAFAADSAQRTVVVSGSVRHIELAGVGPAPRAFGCALLSGGDLVVTAGDLPPLAPGTMYQIWIVSGGTTVRAGELEGVDGRFRSVARAPGLATPTEIAVTLERGPGTAPAGARYLSGIF